jgi:predicted nucleic acid-binding Zn ribbon protein
MNESIQTGGLKQFGYNSKLVLDDERKKGIEDGYILAKERKKREERNRIIFWIVVAMIILILIGYILLSN